MKKHFIIGLIPLLFATITSSIFANATCTCDYINDAPVWGEATIDGNISDWNLNDTYFDDLYKAGKDDGTKPVTSKLYVMYNYVTNVMSVLVLNEPGYETDKSHGLDEFWVKYLNGDKLIDGTYTDFAFVNGGWEAKFQYGTCGCYAIKIHTLQKDDETSANYKVEVYIDCTLPVELSSFTATVKNNNVILDWATESETENQGFLIERRKQGYNWQEIASFLTHNELIGQGSVTHRSEYQFTDVNIKRNRTYEYRLADVDYDGIIAYHNTRVITAEELALPTTPDKFTVKPAFPNPFNPSTNIEYALPKDSMVNVTIYDLLGQTVSSLVNNEQTMGWHQVQWSGNNDDATQMPAGIYIATIKTGNSIKTQKLIYIK